MISAGSRAAVFLTQNAVAADLFSNSEAKNAFLIEKMQGKGERQLRFADSSSGPERLTIFHVLGLVWTAAENGGCV